MAQATHTTSGDPVNDPVGGTGLLDDDYSIFYLQFYIRFDLRFYLRFGTSNGGRQP